MSKCVLLLFVVVASFGVTEPVYASVRRIGVTKANQPQSGIEFLLTVESQDDIPEGIAPITLSLPANQDSLKHLGKTELWIRREKRTVLMVPLALTTDRSGELSGRFSLAAEFLEGAVIALRCGQNAPLAETIYEIELESYARELHAKPAQPGNDSSATTANGIAWSQPMGRLRGRLVIQKTRITASEQFAAGLELMNVGTSPLAVQTANPHVLNMKVQDAAGCRVTPTWSRIDVISSPQWGVIPRDSYLGFPVTIASMKNSHLDATTQAWKLQSGRFQVHAEYDSTHFALLHGENPPPRIWNGRITLPAVEVEVVDDARLPADAEGQWSQTNQGLSGRLRVAFEDLKPGFRHKLLLELKNVSTTSVAVSSRPHLEAALADSQGKPVPKGGFPMSGDIPDPQWGVIPRDTYLGVRVDMTTVGLPVRDQALLAVAGKTWGLKPGTYTLAVKLSAKKQDHDPENQWVGELKLPAVKIRVTKEQLSGE